MILLVVVGSIIAAVVLPLLQGALNRLANRTRASKADRSAEPAVARLHTDRERWEETFDLRAPETVEAVTKQIDRDLAGLDKIERTLYRGLDRIWAQVSKQLELDELDQAWCKLSTGELVSA